MGCLRRTGNLARYLPTRTGSPAAQSPAESEPTTVAVPHSEDGDTIGFCCTISLCRSDHAGAEGDEPRFDHRRICQRRRPCRSSGRGRDPTPQVPSGRAAHKPAWPRLTWPRRLFIVSQIHVPLIAVPLPPALAPGVGLLVRFMRISGHLDPTARAARTRRGWWHSVALAGAARSSCLASRTRPRPCL